LAKKRRVILWVYPRYIWNILNLSWGPAGGCGGEFWFLEARMPVRLSEKAYQLIKEKIVTRDLAPLSVIDEQSLRIDLGLVGLSDRNQGSPVTPG
jgi:hypothetical protein